jgi:hypothetical protein
MMVNIMIPTSMINPMPMSVLLGLIRYFFSLFSLYERWLSRKMQGQSVPAWDCGGWPSDEMRKICAAPLSARLAPTLRGRNAGHAGTAPLFFSGEHRSRVRRPRCPSSPTSRCPHLLTGFMGGLRREIQTFVSLIARKKRSAGRIFGTVGGYLGRNLKGRLIVPLAIGTNAFPRPGTFPLDALATSIYLVPPPSKTAQ